MNINLFPLRSVWVLGLLLAGPTLLASQDSLVTAVFSSVSNGYTRQKNPDGTFKRENYALANGRFSPGAARDPSIEKVPFPTIAGLVAQHLARQNYFLANEARSADILLIISWGTTIPFNDAGNQATINGVYAAMNNVNTANSAVRQAEAQGEQARGADGIQSPGRSISDAARSELEGGLFEMKLFNDMRRNSDEYNARLLGYVKEINSRNDNRRFAGAGSFFDDLIADIESERYYVIVSAYDFRAATQERKRKLLWSTRVSIQVQGSQFDQSLIAMMGKASKYFGQDSGQLIRQYQPNTRVDLGEMKILGVVPNAPEEADPTRQK